MSVAEGILQYLTPIMQRYTHLKWVVHEKLSDMLKMAAIQESGGDLKHSHSRAESLHLGAIGVWRQLICCCCGRHWLVSILDWEHLFSLEGPYGWVPGTHLSSEQLRRLKQEDCLSLWAGRVAQWGLVSTTKDSDTCLGICVGLVALVKTLDGKAASYNYGFLWFSQRRKHAFFKCAIVI